LDEVPRRFRSEGPKGRVRIVVVVFALFAAFAPAVAAQPAQPAQPHPVQPRGPLPTNVQPAQPGRANPVVVTTVTHPHYDVVESSGKGMAALFWVFAATMIGGALFVVTRRNLIAAVMGMVGSFLG